MRFITEISKLEKLKGMKTARREETGTLIRLIDHKAADAAMFRRKIVRQHGLVSTAGN